MSAFEGRPSGETDRGRGTQLVVRDGVYSGVALGITALIVDDNWRNRFALTVLLKRGGLAVLEASSGGAAIETLEQRTDIDIVLIDIMMPVMDGYETMARVRALPGYSDVPMIAVTAKPVEGELERCVAAGASGYVSKPIDPRELFVAIRRWLPADPARSKPLAPPLGVPDREADTMRLEHRALYDGLTGLAKRPLFEEHVLQALTSARRNVDSRVVLVIDLNGFNHVNARTKAGDSLLSQFAGRLLAALRENDTIARLGGHTFAVLSGQSTDLAGATEMAYKLQGVCEAGFVVDDDVVYMSTSIGIALFPHHARTTTELITCAYAAMRVAKKSESGQAVFAATRETGSARQHASLIALREGVAGGELVLHYQPKIDLATRDLSGVEALVRWQHPVLGLLPAGSFIPDVNRTALIERITRWVLTEALAQQRSWRAAGIDLTMAVNISDHSLSPGSDLPETVAELIGASGAEPGSLTLELTERAVVETVAGASDIFARLHNMGARISIDDFGTGHSSVADLHGLPIDELKIDRTFVTHLAVASNDGIVVRSTIQLAHNLGLAVVAEGVEDEVASRLLLEYGCDSAQGFYFGHPNTAEELTEWLTDGPYRAPTRPGH